MIIAESEDKVKQVRKFRQCLFDSGFQPVAVRTDDKKPHENEWNTKSGPLGLISRDALSTGVSCRGLRAIDIDIDDPVKALQIVELVKRMLPKAPRRGRPNSSRVLFLYRASEGEPRKRRIESFKHTKQNSCAVEILGNGQQFVADGSHPHGGDYFWSETPGLDFSRIDLPEVSEEQITLFLIKAAEIIGSPGEGRRSASSIKLTTPNQSDLLAVDEEELEKIHVQLPNNADRDGWLTMAHATDAAFANNPPLGEKCFMKYSMRYPGADEVEAKRVWDTLTGPHYVGAQYLINLAVDAGVDVSRYSLAYAQAQFDAEPPPPGGIPPWKPPLRKSDLYVNKANLPETACDLRDILASKSNLFERGGVVKLVHDPAEGGMLAYLATNQTILHEAHRYSTPWQYGSAEKDRTKQIAVTLPLSVTALYLDMAGERKLPVLNGITSAPILSEDGTISTSEGFHPPTGLYCERIPDLRGMVPDNPTKVDAQSALGTLRSWLSTFCFADRQREEVRLMLLLKSNQESENKITYNGEILSADKLNGAHTSQQQHQPHLLIGQDESAALAALITAICRPSLQLSPGVLITAPALSGAGTGKGLLARIMNSIAFDRAPQAFTGGADRAELEKRIASELLGGSPSLMLDNLNNTSLKSDILASAITERPARVRILGQSRMLLLNSSTFIVVTGNGLSVEEDLARRFIQIELDAGVENPESRSFDGDILAEVKKHRAELLSAALTIWRWGRQNNLQKGKPLGSFQTWCSWVRDPLLALGCCDPVERIGQAKANDPVRQMTSDIFQAWFEHHGEKPMKVSELCDSVRKVIDPAGCSLQYSASAVSKLVGTRVEGFTLVRSTASGNHGSAYAVKRTDQ